ncbi:hypothetical protein [Sporosarcina ureilytica]|uniref:D-glucuronyl C5-epimerase C-terminal domain-containing protein n=1 Tax=Sporosarcina ureilytica TaxID=298596 RepID=A0A1D8JJ81_9BACL|nr:hypothetical protein [Sporosarcina ureilytica]AOV08762.1 hypothetical protein BI350_15235 [Sporosarcina ureilytica]
MKKNKWILYAIGLFFIVLISLIAVKGMNVTIKSGEKEFDKLKKENVDFEKENPEGDYIVLALKDGVSLLSYGYNFQLEKQEIQEKINANDEVFEYALHRNNERIGNLEIVIREIDNEDKYVFSRFERLTEEAATIPIKLIFHDERKYAFFQFEEEIEQEHDRVFGIDYTSNVKGLYSIGSQYNLFLSQNYISHELSTVYEDGKESVLRELVNEDKHLNITEDDGSLLFELELRTTEKDQISENWLLISNEKLFSSEKVMKEYKAETNHNFISSRKWLTSIGPYTKLPWSVEPSTKLGYGRNLVVLQGTPFVENYTLQPERFYYDMIVNSVNYLWDFKEDTSLWETEYTSTWLKNEYGIIAPYTDTRHNENIALFLSSAGDILKNEALKDSYLLYADFLSEQEDIDNILRTEKGYYILDYYSDVQTKKTHVSLNHALGEMSYLFNAYQQTNNDEYLQVALKIKQAVEDIGTMWINPTNGDLWYQINGDYTFEGKDYDTLTLSDLATGVEYYEKLQIPYSDVHKELMSSKIDYLIENEVEMLDTLYDQLISLGFEEQLKDYNHVISYKK